MMAKNRGYIDDIDRLIEQTDVAKVLNYFNKPTPENSSGEFRMPCVFNEECADSSYGSLTIKLDDAANRIYCHACGVRGNLLTLIHGLKQRQVPASGRLRGEEFKDAVTTLKQINSGDTVQSVAASKPAPKPATRTVQENIPLKDQEKTASLENLYEDLISDISQMPPEVASYFRQRPWLTPEVCKKWKMGYLPSNGRSLMRGLVVYAHENRSGDVISYSGRDVRFDKKWNKWIQDGRPEKGRPAKHRYVKGFHKGIELYGQESDRLLDPQIKKSLGEIGVVVVEGQNDVIRLDCLGVAAVGLCMNKATQTQIEKLEKIAAATNGQVVLMPDNDVQGEAGFKELIWELSSRGVITKLAWSRDSDNGAYSDMQPEDILPEHWQAILPFLRRK